MKWQQTVVVTDGPETVDIAFADPAPVDELDPELEGPLGAADEFDLVDLEHLVE